tara:strand:+ start:678 stop:1574 length:897 start_codon:yes stop_codon:yes gene_type:complete
MRKLILIIGAQFMLFSCSTTKTLSFVKLKNDTKIIKHVNHNPLAENRTHDIVVYNAKKDEKVKLTLEEEKLRLTFFSKKNLMEIDKIETGIDFDIDEESSYRIADKFGYKAQLKEKSIIDLDSSDGVFSVPNNNSNLLEDSDFSYTVPIIYSDNKPVLQTLTIPFKFRGSVKDISSTITTGFNAGIAYGYQWNIVTVAPIYNTVNGSMQGYDKQTKSFALAPFAGLTSISLEEDNTNKTIENSKTVIGLSLGGVGVLTYNRFNIGLALGIDYGLEDSKEWIYQGRSWTGLVLGLDLIK